MSIHPSVAQHIPRIRELAEEYGVAKLEIFGSAMTDAFDVERSDVDFIVHYPEGYSFGYFGKNLFDLEDNLAKTLGRPAQLVMTSALEKNYFRETANATRTTIYVGEASETTVVGNTHAMSVHN